MGIKRSVTVSCPVRSPNSVFVELKSYLRTHTPVISRLFGLKAQLEQVLQGFARIISPIRVIRRALRALSGPDHKTCSWEFIQGVLDHVLNALEKVTAGSLIQGLEDAMNIIERLHGVRHHPALSLLRFLTLTILNFIQVQVHSSK